MFTTGFMFIIIIIIITFLPIKKNIITFCILGWLMPGDILKQHLNTKHMHMDMEEKRDKLHIN